MEELCKGRFIQMTDISKKQKIAIYLPSLRGGGAERIMVTLANDFVRRGFAVDLVLAKAEGPYLEEVSESVRTIDLGALRVFSSLPRLVRYLNREQPAALLSALSHANVVAVLARALSHVHPRLVVSERNSVSASTTNAKSMRGRMMGLFMRVAYPYADAIVAISSGVADDLSQTIGIQRESIRVVYNPAVTTDVMQNKKKDLDHPWFGPGMFPVILAVGRLTAQKDFPTLINAFSKIHAQRDVKLMILGEGALRDELTSLIQKLDLQDDVSMPGFVENPHAYMRHAALFVMSSAWEGFGNVLAETMACGTPVVSTDCPSGPAEILDGGKWGRLVPVGDVNALAEAIDATLAEGEHPDVEKRAMDFGVEQAAEKYLIELGMMQ
jgi:glycosyltransferase involved in cell wall biosynthesis